MLEAEDTWGLEEESQAQSTVTQGLSALTTQEGRASWKLSVVEQGQNLQL